MLFGEVFVVLFAAIAASFNSVLDRIYVYGVRQILPSTIYIENYIHIKHKTKNRPILYLRIKRSEKTVGLS